MKVWKTDSMFRIDLKHDTKDLQKLGRWVETWKKFKLHFTGAISDNKKEPKMNLELQNANCSLLTLFILVLPLHNTLHQKGTYSHRSTSLLYSYTPNCEWREQKVHDRYSVYWSKLVQDSINFWA